MSDHDSQHEFDDELLSAYLDDELSPEERAAVEARLAVDAHAQQMLRQMRAVSQAVQGLPQEALGHDIRDSVLRKAHERRADLAAPSAASLSEGRGSSNGEPAAVDASIPKLTIGKTRRGWLWASLAVAAALVIMVFQSDPEHGKNLLTLAQRDERLAKDEVPQRRIQARPLELRALKEQADPPAAPVAANSEAGATMDRLSTSQDYAEDESAAERMSASGAVAPEQRFGGQGIAKSLAPLAKTNQPADAPAAEGRGSDAAIPGLSSVETLSDGPSGGSSTELLAAMPPSDEEGRYDRGNLAEQFAQRKPTGEADKNRGESEVVLVRVVVKRSALEGKAFDRLLEQNGIAIESNAPETEDASGVAASEPSTVRFRERNKVSRRGALPASAENPKDAGTEADILLVQAAPTAIVSCLQSLHEDSANYPAVVVGGAIAADAGVPVGDAMAAYSVAGSETSEASTRAAELGWTKFSRGVAPQQDVLLRRDRIDFFYRFGTDDRNGSAPGFGGGSDGRQILEQLKQQQALDKKSHSESNRGWAWRVSSLNRERELWGEPTVRSGVTSESEAPTSAESLQLGRVQLELKSPTQAGAETLPVLFVLTPDDAAAPSPASENRAE